jgi:hypothetical protein
MGAAHCGRIGDGWFYVSSDDIRAAEGTTGDDHKADMRLRAVEHKRTDGLLARNGYE